MSTARTRPNPFPPNWQVRLAYTGLLLYVLYALHYMDISFIRMIEGLGNGKAFLAEMFPPAMDKWPLLISDLIESIEIAIIASFLGILLSLPIGLLAARNMMPPVIYWPMRAFIAITRSFHPMVLAILFVKAVGFGPLPGILTLVFATIGFIAKLFAEAIEEISLKPVEAVRASGAPFMSVIIYAVLPQVLNRFIGFSSYQLDVNLRNSTMLGIVGAGGIGGTLFAAFQRFDYDFVSTILIAIIVAVMWSEWLALKLKEMFR
jgi:phosphonate ABC transporter, permease protein PhnE